MVQAVLKLAAKQEPASITTNHIAAEVGLSQGSVFRHFPNKEAVWGAVADWLEASLLLIVRGAVHAERGPLDNLAAIFQAHIRFVQENPGVPRFIFHELQQPAASPVKKKVATMLQAYSSLLVDQLQHAKAAGLTEPQLDEESAAMLFIGCLQGLVMQSMLAGPAVLQRSSSGVLDLYFRAVQRGGEA